VNLVFAQSINAGFHKNISSVDDGNTENENCLQLLTNFKKQIDTLPTNRMRMRLDLALGVGCLLSLAVADTDKDKKKNAKLPPCGACTNLVSSFEKGMERTKRFKLEGGDSAWEEKKQPRYATSEVRLIEIGEELCKDVDRGETHCHQLHNDWEEHLEAWWKQEEESRAPLRQFLCVETLEVCCAADHYGPDCLPCSFTGKNGKLCSGNGKCKGGGTRKGNGQCSCDKEYIGQLCDNCSAGHYSSYSDDDTRVCSACHKACADVCSGPGPKSCMKCTAGYQMDAEHGCTDLDECVVSRPCTSDKFCVNTEGTFRCLACDKACASCSSDGPDNCVECADGFKDKEGVCVKDKQPEGEGEKEEEEGEEEEETKDEL